MLGSFSGSVFVDFDAEGSQVVRLAYLKTEVGMLSIIQNFSIRLEFTAFFHRSKTLVVQNEANIKTFPEPETISRALRHIEIDLTNMWDFIYAISNKLFNKL